MSNNYKAMSFKYFTGQVNEINFTVTFCNVIVNNG